MPVGSQARLVTAAAAGFLSGVAGVIRKPIFLCSLRLSVEKTHFLLHIVIAMRKQTLTNRFLGLMLGATFLAAAIQPACGSSMKEREDSTVIDFNRNADEGSRAAERKAMVETQIRSRGVRDKRVLEAMAAVPRHEFVPPAQRDRAYGDFPLPIGHGQTISQPYIVALMTELLRLEPGDRVLEIGAGSGYQAAILAELGFEVYTIEIVEELARQAENVLRRLGYDNARVRAGDGYVGWPEAAPFKGVILTAAPRKVPQPLLDQLAVGGRLVVPEGVNLQDLVVYEKSEKGVERRNIIPVRFVPMTGEAEKQ